MMATWKCSFTSNTLAAHPQRSNCGLGERFLLTIRKQWRVLCVKRTSYTKWSKLKDRTTHTVYTAWLSQTAISSLEIRISLWQSECVSTSMCIGGTRPPTHPDAKQQSCSIFSPSLLEHLSFFLSVVALCCYRKKNMFQKVSGNQYSDEGCCFEAWYTTHTPTQE